MIESIGIVPGDVVVALKRHCGSDVTSLSRELLLERLVGVYSYPFARRLYGCIAAFQFWLVPSSCPALSSIRRSLKKFSR